MAPVTASLHVRFIMMAPIGVRFLLAFALFVSNRSEGGIVGDPVSLVALAWALLALASYLLGHNLRRSALQAHFAIDIIVAVAATLIHPEIMLPAALLLFCGAQTLVRSGTGAISAFSAVIPLIVAPFAADAQNISMSRMVGPDDGHAAGYGLIWASVAIGIATAAFSITRGEQLRQFEMQALSLRMLKLDRSLEFDLQKLIELIGSLFPERKVHCLISGNAVHSASKEFALDGPLDGNGKERGNLLDYRIATAERGVIMDNAGGRLIDFAGRAVRPFDDSDRRVAFLLARSGLATTLFKPFSIGRARGVMLVALRQLDAITVHEAGKVGATLDILFPILDSIAEAERNFIADAHDVARRDLHDGVLQTLAAVRMRLLSIGRQRDMKDHPAKASLEKVADILTLEQARLRGLLETSEDEDFGINLVTRLDVSLRTISMQWEIDARLESEEPAIPIDKEGAINIEHLVREAVANAVRHANSKQLTVRLTLNQNSLRVAIVDRNDGAAAKGDKKGEKSMPLRSASLLHRLRLVNGSAYADGLEKSAILAITIPMQRIDNA